MTTPKAEKIAPVKDIRRTTPMLFAALACGIGGHIYRVVVANNDPTALECTRCATTWTTERVEMGPPDTAQKADQ